MRKQASFGTLRNAASLPSPVIRAANNVPESAKPMDDSGGVAQFPYEKQGMNWLSVP
jgi:hypothetical protein